MVENMEHVVEMDVGKTPYEPTISSGKKLVLLASFPHFFSTWLFTCFCTPFSAWLSLRHYVMKFTNTNELKLNKVRSACKWKNKMSGAEPQVTAARFPPSGSVHAEIIFDLASFTFMASAAVSLQNREDFEKTQKIRRWRWKGESKKYQTKTIFVSLYLFCFCF